MATASAFAQGTVNFGNSGGAPLVYLGDPLTGVKLVGTNYVAELYAGPVGGALQPVTSSIAKFRISTTASPGTWTGKSSQALPLGGVGVPVSLAVRVWDASLYSTYEAARTGQSGYVGTSSTFTYLQLLSSPPLPTDTDMVNFTAFGILPVPEPSTIVLGILGASALLLRRRK